jgi:phage-related baseplate assembly protein
LAAIIAAVNTAVNDKRVRPLTDVVRVVSPEVVEFDVVLIWFVLNSYAHLAGSITQRVESEARAYAAWQRARLGRSLRPSELVARIQAIDGVQRVEVDQPAYQALQPWQVATARQISLTYGGLSDE